MEINITNKTAFPIDEDTHNFILNEAMKCHDIELQKLKQEQIEWLEKLYRTGSQSATHGHMIEERIKQLKGE